MIDCTPSAIIEASKCYCGLTSREDFSVSIYLLCQWANSNPTPPPAVPLVVWNPPDSLMNYQDGSGAHASIDYPTFLAAVDYSTLVSVSMFDTDNWRITDFLANNVPSLQTVLINGNVNTLTSVDVTGCTGLLTLDCSGSNTLNSLVGLGTCVSLTTLDCDSNSLVTLDLTGLSALTAVDCSIGASLTTLTLTGCTALTTLDCSSCALTALDVSTCTAIVNFNCYNNLIETLDLHNCVQMDSAECDSNVIGSLGGSLNVTGLSLMTILDCKRNQFPSIVGISTCTALSVLDASYGGLTAIDLSACTLLTSIGLSYNTSLASLNVTGCSIAALLNCSYCALTTLDVSTCTSLNAMFASYNSLTSCVVLGAVNLTNIILDHNSMNSAAVDTVLCNTDTNGALAGNLRIDSNSVPTPAGLVCSASLDPGKGWSVVHD